MKIKYDNPNTKINFSKVKPLLTQKYVGVRAGSGVLWCW